MADPLWGRPLLVALVVVLGYRQIRKPGLLAAALAGRAAAGAYWFLTAFNQSPAASPTSSRYQYAGAVFVLMILANLLQGVRPSRGAR